ncbi:MAG: hypothetical protein NVSMB56_18230 [Pyrinomonadaceae bacterium]
MKSKKKYRLTKARAAKLRAELRENGAEFGGDEFEENVLYAGGMLDVATSVLRLRRTEKRAVLTYKKRGTSQSDIKQQLEEETEVSKPDALAAILDALKFTPALVYEKRRETWHMKTSVGAVEVVIDELPFGWYSEIEGAEPAIIFAERILKLARTKAEQFTYPTLTMQHGVKNGAMIEARFQSSDATKEKSKKRRRSK